MIAHVRGFTKLSDYQRTGVTVVAFLEPQIDELFVQFDMRFSFRCYHSEGSHTIPQGHLLKP